MVKKLTTHHSRIAQFDGNKSWRSEPVHQHWRTRLHQNRSQFFETKVWGISGYSGYSYVHFVQQLLPLQWRFFQTNLWPCYGVENISHSGNLPLMSELEKSAIFKETLLHPPIFLRCIDNCLVIIDRDADFEIILQRLNNSHGSIKFELKKIREDKFLPFLDTAIHLSENGQLQQKFFVKEANRGLFILANSALPDSTKRNAIRSEMERDKSLCSESSSKCDAIQHMREKFLSNGFTEEKIKRFMKPHRRKNNQPRSFDCCILKVPFVSDKFNGQTEKLWRRPYSLDSCVVTNQLYLWQDYWTRIDVLCNATNDPVFYKTPKYAMRGTWCTRRHAAGVGNFILAALLHHCIIEWPNILGRQPFTYTLCHIHFQPRRFSIYNSELTLHRHKMPNCRNRNFSSLER